MSVLRRESLKNSGDLEQLCLESAVRKWLNSMGIPSWRNPSTPVCGFTSEPFRYSLMLAGGSRLLVCPLNAMLNFDRIAGAKCFAVIAAGVKSPLNTVSIAGVLPLSSIPPGTKPFRMAPDLLLPPLSILKYLRKPSSRILSLLMFGSRLIILGEPDAPPEGAGGIRAFNPAAAAPGEV